MKYDPKKKLFYYDIHSEEYKQTDHPALHTTLYQYDDDLKDFEIVVMNEEEKVNYLYGEALAAIKKYAENKADNVNHPKHYEGSCSIECIDAMRFALGDEGLAFFCAGNAFKYLWRYKFKNGQEDLDKAGWYHNMLSELMHTNWNNTSISPLYKRVNRLYLNVTGRVENEAFEDEEDEEDD